MTDTRRHRAAEAAIALGAAAVFSWYAYRVATGRAKALDQRTRRRLRAGRRPALDIAVKPITILSLPVVVVGATAMLALWLERSGRSHAALAVAAAPVLAATAGQSFTTFLAQRNPPDARDAPDGEVTEPSFPSGHTTGITSESLIVAYVLLNEGLLTPAPASALAAWPLVVGAARIYRERHWLTDILGGWAAGIAVGALAAMLYE